MFSTAWNGIKSAWSGAIGFFSGIWSGITSVFSVVGGWFKNIFSTAWSNIKSAWSGATGWFGNVWSTIKNTFKPDLITNGFKTAWNNIKSTWSGAPGWFGGVWSKIKSAFKPDMISTGFSNAWGAIQSAWGNAGSWFGGIWKSIENGFKSLNPLQWGKDLLGNFIDGIKSKMADLRDAVGNIGKTIKSHLHFSEPDEGPLVGFSTWMPDMMEGIRQGILNNMYRVASAVNQVAATMASAIPVIPDSGPQVRTAMAAAYGGYSVPAVPVGNLPNGSGTAPGTSGDVKVYQYFQGKVPSPAEHARLTRNGVKEVIRQIRK